jgi:hypothetical protein
MKTTEKRKFTTADIITSKPLFDRDKTMYYLPVDTADLTVKELDWQRRGLMQTASGYGRKLTTRYTVHFNGRARRVYCCCQSNSGTCYIIHDGNWLILNV